MATNAKQDQGLKYVGAYSEGFAPAETEQGRWGFINHQGEFVIPPIYDYTASFREGLARVRRGDREYHIQHSGRRAYQADFEEVGNFSEGVAPARDEKGWFHVCHDGSVSYSDPGLRFRQVANFIEDQAEVQSMDGRFHYIRHDGAES